MSTMTTQAWQTAPQTMPEKVQRLAPKAAALKAEAERPTLRIPYFEPEDSGRLLKDDAFAFKTVCAVLFAVVAAGTIGMAITVLYIAAFG